MELKIRIREVKEDTRLLTAGELCMILVSREDVFSETCRDTIRKELDSIGFVDYVDYDRAYGLFRTETIRDATPEEIIAWHCIQIWKPCDMIEGKCVANCPKKGVCEVVLDYKKSMAILIGKEVILEVI